MKGLIMNGLMSCPQALQLASNTYIHFYNQLMSYPHDHPVFQEVAAPCTFVPFTGMYPVCVTLRVPVAESGYA